MTGDDRFEKAAYKAYFALWNRKSEIGLVGNTINVQTGVCLTSVFHKSKLIQFAVVVSARNQWNRCWDRFILRVRLEMVRAEWCVLTYIDVHFY